MPLGAAGELSIGGRSLILSPREVFEQPTLGDLATAVAAATGDLSDQGPVTGELPLSFAWAAKAWPAAT
ncbi:MAG: hypothetical protein GY856_26815 [bacterium]|nr:hypothetical protein [bacterium]